MIRLEQVSKYYKSNALVAVGMRKVNLEFKIGEFVAVTGESGSGKSTLLNILSGLDTFEEGEFFLFNEPTSHYTIAQWEAYRAAYVGFVFQNYNIIESYTVLQNVLMSLEFQGYEEENRKQRALEIIDRVGLSHRVNHKASKLSGGEKQRTVIARALAKDCPAILCDEPTGNLDSKTGEEIIQLLHEISKKN
jgi:putative ABC transport system permease protein